MFREQRHPHVPVPPRFPAPPHPACLHRCGRVQGQPLRPGRPLRELNRELQVQVPGRDFRRPLQAVRADRGPSCQMLFGLAGKAKSHRDQAVAER